MNKYTGSNFDDFWEEEGILEEVTAKVHKRLLATTPLKKEVEMQKSIADYATCEDLLTVDWNKTVGFALRKMKELHKSCLLIVDRKGRVIGIVTEHDEESTQPLAEFCQRELKTITFQEAEEMNSRKAAQYMWDNGFHRIIIKEAERVGIFTSTDFIKMVAEGN